MENELINGFIERFKEKPDYIYDAGGRFEILGNHTDHNHGLCLVANCSLRIYAAIKKCDDVIEVKSKGYSFYRIALEDLNSNFYIPPSSKAINYGIAKKLKSLGYKVGGFKAYIISEIPDGSGVSSSAAIESLFGYIFSYLYNEGKISSLLIAKIGQYSENVFFKKPCGLLDQIGTSYPNCNFIDFKNIENPTIENIDFNLPLSLYLIKSSGDHSNLTSLYAAIPSNMKEVANLIDNKAFLRDLDDTNIFKKIDELNISETKKNMAKHFFIENQNVLDGKKAIENGDVEGFLNAIRNSQNSSKSNLKNTFVEGDEYLNSPQDIIDKVEKYIGNHGAIRIHGGGFKGTVLAFIKNDFKEQFVKFLEDNYKDKYYKVSISKKAINIKKL